MGICAGVLVYLLSAVLIFQNQASERVSLLLCGPHRAWGAISRACWSATRPPASCPSAAAGGIKPAGMAARRRWSSCRPRWPGGTRCTTGCGRRPSSGCCRTPPAPAKAGAHVVHVPSAADAGPVKGPGLQNAHASAGAGAHVQVNAAAAAAAAASSYAVPSQRRDAQPLHHRPRVRMGAGDEGRAVRRR